MSKFIYICIVAIIYTKSNCIAQDIPVSKPNSAGTKKTAKNKPVVNPKSIAVLPIAKGTINIASNEDCVIRINNIDEGSLKRGETKTIRLDYGSYKLIATSTPNSYLYETEFTVRSNMSMIWVDLASVIASVKRTSDSVDKIKTEAAQEKAKTDSARVTKNSSSNTKDSDIEAKNAARVRQKSKVDSMKSNPEQVSTGSLVMTKKAADNGESPQRMLRDFFNSSKTTALYLGIDFTKSKLIDDVISDERDIKDHQYFAINELIITELKKYDLKDAFNKGNINFDLDLVEKQNKTINEEEIKSSNTGDFHRLKEADINDVVNAYNFGDKKGIGIMFVMEAMSQSSRVPAIAIWVTFIDMKAKKVLLTERMEEKTSGGRGFRNLWGNSIKSLLDDIDNHKYKAWKNKYQ